jgi:hypothetical protein
VPACLFQLLNKDAFESDYKKYIFLNNSKIEMYHIRFLPILRFMRNKRMKLHTVGKVTLKTDKTGGFTQFNVK